MGGADVGAPVQGLRFMTWYDVIPDLRVASVCCEDDDGCDG